MDVCDALLLQFSIGIKLQQVQHHTPHAGVVGVLEGVGVGGVPGLADSTGFIDVRDIKAQRNSDGVGKPGVNQRTKATRVHLDHVGTSPSDDLEGLWQVFNAVGERPGTKDAKVHRYVDATPGGGVEHLLSVLTEQG